MGLVGSANLAAINTAFDTTANKIFAGGIPGAYQAMTQTISGLGDSTSIEIVVADGLPQVRQWTGMKQFFDLRTYKLNSKRVPYEASIALPRIQVDGDKSGVLGQRVADLPKRAASAYNKIVMAAFVANSALGYDGSALLANSHANTAGNADNLEAAALTLALLNTGIKAIELRTDELGEPLGLYARKLLVGPAQRRLAMQLTGSMQPYAMTTGGVEGTSTIESSFLIENYTGGEIDVLVDPRLTGNEWLLFDDSQAGIRPFYLAEFRSPVAIAQTDPSGEARFQLDEYRWSVEFDIAVFPGAWQCCHGSVT